MRNRTGYIEQKLSSPESRLRALEAMGLTSYQEYIQSDHWRKVRQRFFTSRLVRKDGNGSLVCECCLQAGRLVHVHHKTYKRLGKERLGDLAVLCGECHQRVHEHYWKHKNKGLWRVIGKVRRSRHPLTTHK